MKTDPSFFKLAALLVATVTGLAGGAGVGRLRADDVLPTPFPADHFSKMASHSPFTPPTAPIATPPPAPTPQPVSFADKLTVTSLLQRNGVFYAWVIDQDNQHLYLSSEPVTKPDQIQISSVKGDPASTANEAPVITLRKGVAFGTVRYEPGSGGASIAGGPGIPGPPRQGILPGTVLNRPGAAPSLPGSIVNPTAPVNNGIRRPLVIPAPRPQPPPGSGGRPVVLPGTATTLRPTVRPGVGAPANDDDDDDD